MPGIGKLDDLEFLQAFKSMNRVILNKAFLSVFGGAMIAVFLVPVSHFALVPKALFWFYISISVLYAVGVLGVTVNGNIPLNELLDTAHLDAMSTHEIEILRERVESKWNSYHLMRTACSAITFVGLILSIYSGVNREGEMREGAAGKPSRVLLLHFVKSYPKQVIKNRSE